ncbi:thioesterase-like superfamily-domain-containing protein [Endogone sp. FLAS-F59071]|nr:thioesterase-like superfamily-domain-containing protein [Endogone sp. FLAS-F59071]|eukprot:RUS22699.1 thioesterase-like superfamily-domain-containing protein [Endogone sp. FLAS-F59071]
MVGYVASCVLNAFRQYFEKRPQTDPVSLNIFFLSKNIIAEFIIEVWSVKDSKKGYALAYAALRQKKIPSQIPIISIDDYNPSDYSEQRIHAITTFGDYATENGLTLLTEPTVPPSRSAFTLKDFSIGNAGLGPLIVWQPDLSYFSTEITPGKPIANHSIAFADGRKPDVWSLPYFADMFYPPPALLGRDTLGGDMWFPTMQMEVQFKSVPVGRDMVCAFKSRHIINGRFDVDGELWDEEGTLVATTRHQCLIVPWSRNSSIPARL